jgi:5-methylcytosine-specific restriction endonuclease McrA
VDRRKQHRAMLSAIAEGTDNFVFYSRKLRDDQPRNSQFCGELFLPGQQPGLETPYGPAYWRRTLCGDECQGLRSELRRREQRTNAVIKASIPGVKVDRVTILERDGFVCYLCGGQTIKGYRGPDRKLRSEMDHVVPLGRGLHHPNNLRCCCGRCNLEKGTKTLSEAVRISSCGDIDFDNLDLVGTPATLDELRSAWKQWVLPGIDEEAEVRGYADPTFEGRWTTIYRSRILQLEELAALEPENDKRLSDLSLAYIGQSNFLRQYNHLDESLNALTKRLAICERLAIAKPTNIHFLDTAVCLFDMTKIGADAVSNLKRLRETLSTEAMRYIYKAIIHMSDVAERREAARNAKLT